MQSTTSQRLSDATAVFDNDDQTIAPPTPTTATAPKFNLDLAAADKEIKNNEAIRGRFDDVTQAEGQQGSGYVPPALSQGRKWVLLSILSLAMFIDVL